MIQPSSGQPSSGKIFVPSSSKNPSRIVIVITTHGGIIDTKAESAKDLADSAKIFNVPRFTIPTDKKLILCSAVIPGVFHHADNVSIHEYVNNIKQNIDEFYKQDFAQCKHVADNLKTNFIKIDQEIQKRRLLDAKNDAILKHWIRNLSMPSKSYTSQVLLEGNHPVDKYYSRDENDPSEDIDKILLITEKNKDDPRDLLNLRGQNSIYLSQLLKLPYTEYIIFDFGCSGFQLKNFEILSERSTRYTRRHITSTNSPENLTTLEKNTKTNKRKSQVILDQLQNLDKTPLYKKPKVRSMTKKRFSPSSKYPKNNRSLLHTSSFGGKKSKKYKMKRAILR